MPDETQNSQEKKPQKKPDKPSKPDLDKIIIRPYPKVILLYPTAIACLILGLIQVFMNPESENYEGNTQLFGLIFFIVFGLNLLVFSFEFSRLKTFTIGITILALLFLALWLGEKLPVLQYLHDFVDKRNFSMSDEMYLGFFFYFLLIFIGVFINTRFNFYVIKHNEIYHKTGFLGKVKRFPSPNLRMSKEITDVFEFLLLRSGRLIMYPESEQEAIVLDNVLRINVVDEQVNTLLSKIAVEIEHPD